ncbi:hypothetical protein [Bifidobacterium leontopitheci]|uniref:Uncharacterized protein n=1 Tax=Bifidobacterium leontopitheci TaxID=2650774 RepID=A0A6I1GLV5_9BIFI|nr:hypothetical protein [Bifidobacterium leontopitheci]KAB7790576.1 hypothetical protein F7D09_0945 [Bifidobacterium leontopitheci]
MSDAVSAVVYPGKLTLTAEQFEQIFGWRFSSNNRVEATSPVVEWENGEATQKKKLFDGAPAYEARGLEASALDPTTGEYERQVLSVKVRVRQPMTIPRRTDFVPEGNVTVTFSVYKGYLNCTVLVDGLVPAQRPQGK